MVHAMQVLDKQLPVWISDLAEIDDLNARLDNNWHSPAASLAEAAIANIDRRFELATLSTLAEDAGITTGVGPSPGGGVGLIEGRNLRPNYVIPLFTKFGTEPMQLLSGDLLLGKDGEPGTAALLTQALLDYCRELTIGNHVYLIRLKPEFRALAPFISAFLNSRNGQAVVRKRIAGGTTPTIRKADVASIPVIIPSDHQCPADIKRTMLATQTRIIQAMDNLGPSNGIADRTGVNDIDVRLPTNWAGGGAQRSSRIIT